MAAGPLCSKRGEHHVGQLVLVLWHHVDEVGHAAQVADVEQPVMGRPIVAGEPAAVHAEDHRQVLQADVMHDRIERAL